MFINPSDAFAKPLDHTAIQASTYPVLRFFCFYPFSFFFFTSSCLFLSCAICWACIACTSDLLANLQGHPTHPFGRPLGLEKSYPHLFYLNWCFFLGGGGCREPCGTLRRRRGDSPSFHDLGLEVWSSETVDCSVGEDCFAHRPYSAFSRGRRSLVHTMQRVFCYPCFSSVFFFIYIFFEWTCV